ncbi:MAG: ThiF family adenylyltransferase [Oscillospiraceae bacterium]|nr:ThiF family adenylyltransferase [Oscillospiraceae bacterium]
MFCPSENLKRARRRFEEIAEARIIDDWLWDSSIDRFYIHFSVEIENEYENVPKKTEWYLVADPTYPFGDIDVYPSRINGIVNTFPHQNCNYLKDSSHPWRPGKLCLDFVTNSLGVFSPEKEPTTVDDRLYWHINRVVAWIYAAAKSELLQSGDYYESPQYPAQDNGLFAFNEDCVSFIQWEDSSKKYGIAKVYAKSLNGTKLYYTSKFVSYDESECIYELHWGSFLTSTQSEGEDALWIKLSSPPVVNIWQAPMTLKELQAACNTQGIDFLELLKLFAVRCRDGVSHLVLFGYPAPRHIGEDPAEMIWQALKLPIMSCQMRNVSKFQSGKKKHNNYTQLGASRGFRPNEAGWWNNDRRNIITDDMPISWLKSQNWSAHTVSSRGVLPSSITSKQIAIIGSGSLGASICELLVRSGATHLCCIDYESLEIGNLSRHTLAMQNIGENKAKALAAHLLEINPHAQVEYLEKELSLDIHEKLIPDLSRFNLIIDTTGNDSVLRLLSIALNVDHAMLFSASVGLGAKRLYLCLVRNHCISVDSYLKALEPHLVNDYKEYASEELPRDGIGCWHPLFPARSGDMWMAACVSINALEHFIAHSEIRSLVAIYEAKEKEGFRLGFSPVATEYNLI